MRNLRKFLSLSVICALVIIGCSKDLEDAMDCSTELLLVDVTHNIDVQNPKMVTFTINYTGKYTLNNAVNWDFGDGQTQAATGNTIVHTYTDLGTHIAKANIEISRGSSKCSSTAKETVHLE
jgi:hypothetical protein